jgi:hypothetical protein
MALCEDAGIVVPLSLADADLLTPYGVALRYGATSPGTVDRPTALELAGGAIVWAARRDRGLSGQHCAGPRDRRGRRVAASGSRIRLRDDGRAGQGFRCGNGASTSPSSTTAPRSGEAVA